MRGLKQYVDIPERIKLKSHASRVRGLKPPMHHLKIYHKRSHASRVRGLKLCYQYTLLQCLPVARFTRAWIETTIIGKAKEVLTVARFTRAWIETNNISATSSLENVARFTRAWIETMNLVLMIIIAGSHASRVRGLKRVVSNNYTTKIGVARFTRAWIETILFLSHSHQK